MNLQERQQFWQQQIDAWQATDLSGAAFCKQQGLNYHSLFIGVKKANSQKPQSSRKRP